MASLFEREAGLLMGPRGAEGRKRISELGIQSLKENYFPGPGFPNPDNKDED